MCNTTIFNILYFNMITVCNKTHEKLIQLRKGFGSAKDLAHNQWDRRATLNKSANEVHPF